MTRYAASQALWAVVLTVVGAVKVVRIVADQIDDALSNVVGLS
jgi:hypothetical protein